jgi:hypothetical protein
MTIDKNEIKQNYWAEGERVNAKGLKCNWTWKIIWNVEVNLCEQ